MAEQTQTFANHVRWYPLFHFVATPLLVVLLIWNVVLLYRTPSWGQVAATLLVIAVGIVSTAGRLQVLRVQDRLIRLEERLRYREILSPELASRACQLPIAQMIALRFASDTELPQMVEQALAGGFSSGKEIKVGIRDWRADNLRA